MTARMSVGALWMVLFKLVDRSLGFISTLILARLLVPSDFGIVAMATSLIALIDLFSSFGLDSALIQRRNADRDDYNTAWTLNALAGLGVGVLIVAAAIPASLYFREPRLTPVAMLLGLCSVLQGLENVGVVDFRRNLQFHLEFRYMAAKKFIAFCLTVPLAFWLRNYWALVIGMILSRLAVLGLSYLVHSYRPRFSLRSVRHLMHFSKWLVIQNLMSFARERSPDLVIGRVVSSAGLGTFGIASQIASMPSTELVAPINRAIFPAYAKLAGDLPELGRQYLAVMGLIALLAVPAVAGIATTAPEIVLLALGPKWTGAIPVLEILAFYGITQVLQTNAYSAFLALGRPDVFARINFVHAATQLVALLILTPAYGILGAAWACLLAAIVALPVNFYMITKRLHLRYRQFIAVLWRPLLAATVMYLVNHQFLRIDTTTVTSSLQVLPNLLISIGAGIFVYCAGIGVAWLLSGRPEGAESWVLAEGGKLIRKFAQQVGISF